MEEFFAIIDHLILTAWDRQSLEPWVQRWAGQFEQEGSITCRFCGAPNRIQARFCVKCGAPMS